MDPGFDAHLRVGAVTFDGDDAAVLAAVEESGSLNAAADRLDRSYSRVHKRLATLEDHLGRLVERQRGGADGGGSRLTPAARDVLATFGRLQYALADTADTEEFVIRGTVRETDGELATVETPVGTVRAVLFEDATTVHVVVRADAVTLHATRSAGAHVTSSARNRFDGEVTAVEARESVARVAVDLGAAVRLPVLLTRESRARLDLSEGTPVLATFKATATRAVPA